MSMNEDQMLQEYRAVIRHHLGRLSPLLVAELSSQIKDSGLHEIPKGCIFCYRLEVRSLASSFPVTSELTDVEMTPCAEKRALLPDVTCTIPEEVLGSTASGTAGIDRWRVTAEVFRGWFSECWEKAGGRACVCFALLEDEYGICNYDESGWRWSAWEDVE
jgi:hypothetical protein